MMNVNYSDTVTDTVKTLREKVYNTEEFKSKFTSELENSICATETKFVPEQFGGWSVNIITDRNGSSKLGVSTQESSSYLKKISDALTSSIRSVNRSVNCTNVVSSNLANVIVTGSNSITVKL